MNTHQWTRQATTTSTIRKENIDNSFAAYTSDHSFGVETTIDANTLSPDTYYVVRHSVRREVGITGSIFIYDVAVRYIFDTNDNLEKYWRQKYDENGNVTEAWGLPFDDNPTTGSTPSGLITLGTEVIDFDSAAKSDPRLDDIPGTTTVRYEFGSGAEGGTNIEGDISSTTLGQGFDIRALGILNQRAEKRVFSVIGDVTTFKADLAALPASTTLFPTGWEPSDDVNWEIGVGGPINTSGGNSGSRTYYAKFTGTLDTGDFDYQTGTGVIGSMETTWNGKYAISGSDPSKDGEIYLGNAFIDYNASSKSPLPDQDDIEAVEREATVLSCLCLSSEIAAAAKQSCPIVAGDVNASLVYNSHLSECEPESLGYGWSDVSHTKIREDLTTNEIVLETTGGGRMRWELSGGTYVPDVHNKYVELNKSSASGTVNDRYVVTYKDQRTQEFGDDKRLKREVDRNDNILTYNYSTHPTSSKLLLDSITSTRGRHVFYTRRSDGQPTEIKDKNIARDVTRTTVLAYYPSGHANEDRLHTITNPENEVTEYIYGADQKLLQVKDARGNVAMEYTYEGPLNGVEFANRVATETIYGETKVEYTHTFTGNSMSMDYTDLKGISPGKTVAMEYDEKQRLLTKTESPILSVIEAEIDALLADCVEGCGILEQDLLDQLYNSKVSTLTLEYLDSNHPFLKTSSVVTGLNPTGWEYDSSGNVTKMTEEDDAGNPIESIYEYADTVDAPLTNLKHRNLLRRIHRPSVEVDGVTVQYPVAELKYDLHGNLEEISRVVDSVMQSSFMTYEADGSVKTVSDFNGNTTIFTYEGSSHDETHSRNLLRVETPVGIGTGGGYRNTDMEYDDFDNLNKLINMAGEETKFVYDLVDRLKSSEDPKGNETLSPFVNGVVPKVTLPPNQASSGSGRETVFTIDSVGRVSEVSRDNGTSQEFRVGYQFDGFSQTVRLERRHDGVGNFYNFELDFKGRGIKVSDFLQQESTTGHPAFCGFTGTTSARGIGFTYQNDGRCLPWKVFDRNLSGPAQESRIFKHDSLRRLVEVADFQLSKYGQSVYGFDYYSSSDSESAEAAPDITKYSYDEIDRLTKIQFHDGKNIAYSYDAVGNVTEMEDPEGKVTKYEYFRDNLLHKAIFERSGQSDRVFEYSYDSVGRPTTITYPSDTEIVAKFEDDAGTPNSGFDENGNLLHLRYEKDGTLIRRFEWTYDDSNNRQSQLEVTPTKAIQWEYGFDWFDRLISVKRAEATTVAGLPATTLQREYVFDESDNRKFFDDHVNGKTYHYKYQSIDDNGTTRYSDQLEEILTSNTVGDRVLTNFTSLETFEHDADGNMTKRIKTGEEITFQWSDYDRLLRVESDQTGRKQDNRYDFNGIRKRKLDINGNSSREYTASISTSSSRADLGSTNVPTISYLSIGGAIVGYEEDDGTTSEFRFFLTDALSSVRDVVDDQGNVVQSYEFDENGNQLPGSGQGSVDSPKTYWGGLSVNDDTADSGLYLAGHRHFDPGLGRFISRDPIGFDGGLNIYALSANNQVTMTDPTGLQPAGILPPLSIPTMSGPAQYYDNPIDFEGWGRVLGQLSDFVHGTPMESTFGPETSASRDFQKLEAKHIQRAIDDWKKKNRAAREINPDCELQSTKFFPYDGGWVNNWGLKGGALKAGHNPTLQFVGGYGIGVSPLSPPLQNELRIDIVNVTSMKSLTYDVPLPFMPDNPFGSAPPAPFHNQTQNYYFYVDRPSF